MSGPASTGGRGGARGRSRRRAAGRRRRGGCAVAPRRSAVMRRPPASGHAVAAAGRCNVGATGTATRVPRVSHGARAGRARSPGAVGAVARARGAPARVRGEPRVPATVPRGRLRATRSRRARRPADGPTNVATGRTGAQPTGVRRRRTRECAMSAAYPASYLAASMSDPTPTDRPARAGRLTPSTRYESTRATTGTLGRARLLDARRAADGADADALVAAAEPYRADPRDRRAALRARRRSSARTTRARSSSSRTRTGSPAAAPTSSASSRRARSRPTRRTAARGTCGRSPSRTRASARSAGCR